MITFTLEDCMQLMARYPDKHFDLTFVDPPYGIGEDWKKRRRHRGEYKFSDTTYKNDCIPPKEYFDELSRISCHQIIWGYNYFTEILGPTNYLIIWNKCGCKNGTLNYSQAEIAFTTIRRPAQVFQVSWDGGRMGSETGIRKIHPHQKPVDLHVKILRKYAKPDWKILDTHAGSGSSVIACHRLALNIAACEIDPQYYRAAKRRIEAETKQQELFCAAERRLQNDFLFEELKVSNL